MPQLYLAVAVISLLLGKLKDLFATIKVSDETKKLIRWGLIGLGLYFVYKIIAHEVNKKNALGDVNGSMAVELHSAIYSQAINLHVPFLGDYHIGNGDEAAILAISERIKDYSQIASFYKDLYGFDLYADLEKVLTSDELATFNANIQKNKAGTTPTPSKPNTTPPKTSTNSTNVGKAVYCTKSSDVNIRSAKDPSKILYKVNNLTTYYGEFGKDKGYVGDFILERKIVVSGVTYSAYEIDIPYEKQGLSFGLNGLIVKDFARIKP